jgi:arsenate reductase-like glutaredoxin family protein
MSELIIIKTNESEKVKKFLQQEHINYEIYQEKSKKISEEKLGQAYQEA